MIDSKCQHIVKFFWNYFWGFFLYNLYTFHMLSESKELRNVKEKFNKF